MAKFVKSKSTKAVIRHLVSGIILLDIVTMQFSYAQSTIKKSNRILQHTTAVNLPAESRNNPIFQSLPTNFEYNAVRCIFKDHKGYMWFGTGDGLVRFDGINLFLYQYDPASASSLSNNSVNAMVEDESDNLWIATSEGLNCYNREKDNFIRITNPDPELYPVYFNYINSICSVDDSLLWLGTFTGIYSYNIKNSRIENYTYSADDPQSISMDHITCFAVDRENNIWIGTQNGLNLYQGERGVFRRFFTEPGNNQSLSNNNISSLTVDHDGNVWAGTQGGGVNKIIVENGKYRFQYYSTTTAGSYLSNNYILSLQADKKGNMWIGTDNGGLNRLNIKSGRVDIFKMVEGEEYSLNSNSIWALYVDNENRIWIGSYNKGINVIDEHFRKFELFQKNLFNKNSLTDNDVTGFAEDSKGYVWIATDGGGICRFDPETRQIVQTIYNSEDNNILANNAVQAILCDSDDNIWIGTWAGGVDKLNSKGIRIRNYKLEVAPGIGNNYVIELYIDSKGTLWAGTSGNGLFRYDKFSDKFLPVSSTNQSVILNSSSYIVAILEDSFGTLWIGTVYGLGIVKRTDDQSYECTDILSNAEPGSLSGNAVSLLFEDSKKRLWLGTSDQGLNLLNRKDLTFRVFNKNNGLPSNSIRGILEDDKGQFWISTNKGITRFSYDSLVFTNYSREDGLNSNEFYVMSCLRTRNGEFYFGGENGFNVFTPGNIRSNTFIPPVYLTDLKINNRSMPIGAKNSPLKKHISETTEITLNYKQSSFSIDFVALNYTHPSGNQFCYKLEGFENEWTCIGNQRSAIYTNIMPGKYIFLVKGSNNDGIWNNTPTRLIITIKQPYWKTWVAKIIYAIILMLIGLIYIRIRNERITIQARLKVEQLAREKEHEMNESNIRFFTNVSHEFRTPLSLIIAPLENLIASTQSRIKDQLTVIYRNAERLLHLTNNLMDMRKLEEGMTRLKVQQSDLLKFISETSTYFSEDSRRRAISYSIESEETAIEGWFDFDKLETILLNLLSNAFKYTEDNGRIRLVVKVLKNSGLKEEYTGFRTNDQYKGRYVEVSVIDNGKGIPEADLPHVFEKFYRAGKSGTKKNSGTGIGLALTKGLIEVNHGGIWAKSEPGIETSFVFILPIDREAFNEDELVLEPSDVITHDIVNYPVEQSAHDSTQDSAQSESGTEKSEILLVEDNDELRTFIANELAREYVIKEAGDGKEGIDIALSDVPDLIVSDILMPECSGIELCQVVKSDVRTSHIPVILLTAKTSVNEQIEGIKTGADAYITKPFNIQYLLAQVNQMIQSRKKLYAHFSQDVYIMPNKMADSEIDQKFLQKTIDYIIRNIADNTLNVDELADHLGLSRSNVYRKIKALTGKTIIEFIRMVRLKQAIKLMETKKYSLAEIAYLTGFTSPSYFTKSFKDQYGKPPSEFM